MCCDSIFVAVNRTRTLNEGTDSVKLSLYGIVVTASLEIDNKTADEILTQLNGETVIFDLIYFGKLGGNPGKFFLRNVTGCLYTQRRTSRFCLAGSLNFIIV